MARRPTVKDPRTPQASVEEPTSAVTAPKETPPASLSTTEKKNVVRLGNFTRIDH